MSQDKSNKEDSLLKKVRELGKSAEKTGQKVHNLTGLDSDGLAAIKNISGFFNRVSARIKHAAEISQYVWNEYLTPVANVVNPIVGWTAGKLKSAFMWAAFERENGRFKRDAEGDLLFSGKRLSKVMAGAAAGTSLLFVGASAAYYHGTQFKETVYVTGKQEIDTGELYQFTGCTSLPCSTETDNGKYYQIESSPFFPSLWYPEEAVYANVPQQNAACDIEGYGVYFRSLRWLHRGADFYQNIDKVSCRPYTEKEIVQAVGSGVVMNSTQQTQQMATPFPSPP